MPTALGRQPALTLLARVERGLDDDTLVLYLPL